MLMDLTYWVYRDDYINAEGPDGNPYSDLIEPHTRIPDGFTPLGYSDQQDASGYYGIALYHEASGTVLIVNRGMQLSEYDSHFDQVSKDYEAAGEYRRGTTASQASDAKEFLSQVVRDARLRRPELLSLRWVATGHSLGGAATQVQVALSRKGQILDAPMLDGVTFAALGARKTIQSMGVTLRDGFDSDIDSAIIDYTRIGDGAVLRSSFISTEHPERVGRAVVLNGLRMKDLRAAEERYRF
jgi:hypothetical protein